MAAGGSRRQADTSKRVSGEGRAVWRLHLGCGALASAGGMQRRFIASREPAACAGPLQTAATAGSALLVIVCVALQYMPHYNCHCAQPCPYADLCTACCCLASQATAHCYGSTGNHMVMRLAK